MSIQSDYKAPSFMDSPNGLLPGDVVIFRPAVLVAVIEKVAAFGIKLKNSMTLAQHAHVDSMHASICSKVEEGVPVLAHISDEGLQFRHDTITHKLKRDGDGARPFLVFRPTNKAQKKAMIELANDPSNASIRWELSAALKSYAHIGLLSRQIATDEFTQSSYCSKFVSELIQRAEVRSEQAVRTDLLADASPADIEGALYSHPHYDVLVYPGQSIYSRIRCCMLAQFTKIAAKKGSFSQKKAEACRKRFLDVITQHKFQKLNDFQRSIVLLQEVLPLLNERQHGNLNTGSFNVVSECARRQGIFRKDIQNYKAI